MIVLALSEALTTGLFTLGGVIVGGLLNYLVTAVLEARRARHALRTGARLVAEELGVNQSILKATLEVGRYLPMANAPLKLAVWEEHRAVLAARLPYRDWIKVRAALRYIGSMDRIHKLGNADRPFSPLDPPHLEGAANAAGEVVEVLERRSTTRQDRRRADR